MSLLGGIVGEVTGAVSRAAKAVTGAVNNISKTVPSAAGLRSGPASPCPRPVSRSVPAAPVFLFSARREDYKKEKSLFFFKSMPRRRTVEC